MAVSGLRRSFWQRFPGILPRLRATEPFRRSVCQKHFDGISRSRLAKRERISSATVERWFGDYLRRMAAERASPVCPQVLGIDEHFFTRRHGYATTFCDLRNHKVHDVVLGRSEASLEGYLNRLEGKHLVKVVCMDLAVVYRSLVRKHFPQCPDRGRPVPRHPAGESSLSHLLAGAGSGGLKESRTDLADAPAPAQTQLEQHRRLVSLSARQYPALETDLPVQTEALLSAAGKTSQSEKVPAKLAPRLLRMIAELRQAGLAPLVQLGNTLHSWREEIATMWRFTRNNGITEGFHTKMEVLQRQAYGFRNFNNYRLRVKVLCS